MLTDSKKEANRRYREAHKEELREKQRIYNKQYQEKNKEQIAEWRKKWYDETRSARNQTHDAWRKANPDRILDTALRRKYGITLEVYRELCARQQERCAICLANLVNLPPQQVHVDHCHTTGTVRGILCSRCNKGIGMFKESCDSLLRAVEYLSRQRDSNP